MTATTGLDVERVTSWLVDHVDGAVAPFEFDQILGGSSNLTYRVTDGAGTVRVLRRPPVNSVLPSAHDMGREHRAMSALAGSDVPVPAMYGLCEDEAVTGAVFYVMEHVPGIQMETAEGGRQLDEAARAVAAETFVDALAALHRVDPDAVGLGEHGRRGGYVERQVRRWFRQWEQMAPHDRPVVRETYERLLEHLPDDRPTAHVVHGDYSFRNCRFALDGRLAAVLDWEISTLGEPLADLGYVLAAWDRSMEGSLQSLPGFPSAAEAADRYSAATGFDVSGLPFYVAFNHWKSACIVEGVFARYRAGALGDDRAAEGARFEPLIENRALAAKAALDDLFG